MTVPVNGPLKRPDFSTEIRRDYNDWLGSRGIFRHKLPDVEKSWQLAWAYDRIEEATVSTVYGRNWDGRGNCPASVIGELARQVNPAGAVTYSAVIIRHDESAGDGDSSVLQPSSLEDLCEIAKVCAELRYEWASIAIWKDRG